MAGGRFHFRFQVSGFRVEVAGCRSEVRFQVSRLRVQGLFQGFKESGFRLQGCRVVGFRFHVAVLQGCRFQVSGFSFRFKVSGFLVQGSEFQISEFQVCFLLSSPPYVPLPPPPPPPPPPTYVLTCTPRSNSPDSGRDGETPPACNGASSLSQFCRPFLHTKKKLVRKDSSFLVGVLEVRRSGLAVEERMEVVVEHAESKVLPSGQSHVFHKCTIVVPVS